MTAITCLNGVDLLMDYLEGALPADMRDAVTAHVAACERCAAFVASYQATPRIIRDTTAVVMPEELQESLLAALRRAQNH